MQYLQRGEAILPGTTKAKRVPKWEKGKSWGKGAEAGAQWKGKGQGAWGSQSQDKGKGKGGWYGDQSGRSKGYGKQAKGKG